MPVTNPVLAKAVESPQLLALYLPRYFVTKIIPALLIIKFCVRYGGSATDWRTYEPEFDFRQEIFLFKASTQALGPTAPLVQWATEDSSLEKVTGS
jgi:hypothetical protein